MITVLVFATAAHAADVYFDASGSSEFRVWSSGTRGDGVCQLAAYVGSDFDISSGFYIDFFGACQ